MAKESIDNQDKFDYETEIWNIADYVWVLLRPPSLIDNTISYMCWKTIRNFDIMKIIMQKINKDCVVVIDAMDYFSNKQ